MLYTKMSDTSNDLKDTYGNGKTIYDEARHFKDDVKTNADDLKNLASKYSRKEISFNFLDKISQYIYTNPNHLIKVEFIQYIMFIALLYIYNPFEINTKFPAFTQLLVLIVAFVYVILFFFIKMKVEAAEDVDLVGPTEKTILYQFISTLVCFFIFMLIFKAILWVLIHTDILTLFHHMFGLVAIICVVGILYLVMRKTIDKAKNSRGKSIFKLLLKMLLFIPCLVVDLVEYVKYEFHLTTKPVWILCGVEAALVAMWVLIPYLFNVLTSFNGVKLLSDPVNLNVETTLSNFNTSTNPNDNPISMDQFNSDAFNKDVKKDLNQQPEDTLDNAEDDMTNRPVTDHAMPKNKYLAWLYKKFKNFAWLKIKFITHPSYTDYSTSRFSYKYGLSGWFYLNPQPPSTSLAYANYTNIMNYGKKINVEYNGKLNSLRVMGAMPAPLADGTKNDTNSNNTSTEIYRTSDIMYQKWNNIVINYDDGIVDVFLNGVLVASASGIMPYMSFDDIVVGADDGIMGGVCNVNYYKDPLAEKTIKLTYKTLRIKEFPYVGTLINTHVNIPKGKKDKRFINDIKRTLGGA